jgi:threonine aldolase
MPAIRIDLLSDTSTRPSEAMRAAMAAAPVGDESRREDPTVNALCARVTELLGKEDAIFLPSGTMCNQIALLVHCGRGDEIIAAQNSHIATSEGAGAAALAGAFVREIPSGNGLFTAADLIECVRPVGRPRSPHSRLVVVEQTHNRGGGTVWPLDRLQAVSDAARERGLALHMDGARLMNAVVASGIATQDMARCADSVWIDFSKGLGCPVGGMLAGTRDFIAKAWNWKYRLGGAMRQAGILAAAALYALDHNVSRLAEDHAKARRLASALAAIPGIRLMPAQIETNLVYFDIAGTGLTAEALIGHLLGEGIRVGAEEATLLRAVTHLDVAAEDVDAAAAAIGRICERHGMKQPALA